MGTAAEGRRFARRQLRASGRRNGRPDTVRVVLFVSIVGVMLFALYTLFLWPTLRRAMSHKGDYIIEQEEAKEHSLRLAPISHLRTSDLADDDDDAQSPPSSSKNNKRPVNVVANKIKEHHAVGTGVAAEYDVPTFPRIPADANYPVRAPQQGTIVYGRAGTAWREGDPTRGLVGIDPFHKHGRNNVKPDGSPGWTPLPDLDWSKETIEEKKERHAHTCFNVRHSDSILLDRHVPDVRSKQCPVPSSYDLSKLPTTSVVFVFFNEPISPLLRSIHSVLNRSPPELLKEIILIDDGSTAEWTGEELAS